MGARIMQRGSGDGAIRQGEEILSVTGLRTQFGPTVIHDHLDFHVRSGEVMGVVGGSGTGKSVLLRTIIGLNKPRAGRIVVLGQDVAALSAAETRALQSRW
ncbi:MAG TPA: ATP-binding cassette domain-containing protein, partial [Kiloniellaceae bacterium]